mmetsp:Transcript_4481/g.8890  ORF Transcript_4481/g.8890 Transcript_4481/m.8890 type:complete len:297 (+) Transcript_4481:160-1050(+)
MYRCMSVRTRSCLTTTTDQSQKEDSDLLALRDTYTKRLLLLTMMTEQQTCMDAVVDQNFSECSREEPPPSSQMMPGDESSCCTSTSFEEWIKTSLSAQKVVRSLALSGFYNPKTKNLKRNICWFDAYLEGIFVMTEKYGEFDVDNKYEEVAFHKVKEQCALEGWNFERVCQVACDEEIEFESFIGEEYESSTPEEEESSLPVCYKTIATPTTPRTPPGFYREIHNNANRAFFPVGKKQQRRKKKKGPKQQSHKKKKKKGPKQQRRKKKRVALEASKPMTIVVERPGKRPCTKLALK